MEGSLLTDVPDPASPLSINDDEFMLVCAVRYAQGRRSYVVGDAARWVRRRWHQISDETQIVLRRDLRAFLEEGQRHPDRLGMAMDAREWRGLAEWIDDQLAKDAPGWLLTGNLTEDQIASFNAYQQSKPPRLITCTTVFPHDVPCEEALVARATGLFCPLCQTGYAPTSVSQRLFHLNEVPF